MIIVLVSFLQVNKTRFTIKHSAIFKSLVCSIFYFLTVADFPVELVLTIMQNAFELRPFCFQVKTNHRLAVTLEGPLAFGLSTLYQAL